AQRYRDVLALVAFLALLPPFLWDLETTPFVYTLGLSLLYFGFGIVLLLTLLDHPWLQRSGVLMGGVAGSLAFMGAHSYSIYLWHIPVQLWAVGLLQAGLRAHLSPWSRFLIYFVGSIVFGIAMSRLVEFPVLRLRDRILPSRSGAITEPNA